MKIAITTVGTDLDSEVDQRFGRARYFIVVDSESKEIIQVIDNQENQNASHGAGWQAAQSIADAGAEWLLTGNVGPNAFSTLEAAGIKIGTGASGTISDTIEKFKAGEFSTTDGPTSRGHR